MDAAPLPLLKIASPRARFPPLTSHPPPLLRHCRLGGARWKTNGFSAFYDALIAARFARRINFFHTLYVIKPPAERVIITVIPFDQSEFAARESVFTIIIFRNRTFSRKKNDKKKHIHINPLEPTVN